MTTTPIEQLASLRVGMVEFISPDRIEVQLDIESPDSVALNTGTPRNFPRINGYVMIPVDLGFVDNHPTFSIPKTKRIPRLWFD